MDMSLSVIVSLNVSVSVSECDYECEFECEYEFRCEPECGVSESVSVTEVESYCKSKSASVSDGGGRMINVVFQSCL